MKRLITFVLGVVVASVGVSAQESVTFRFGCISYDEVLAAMPEYAQIDSDLVVLKAQYDTEMSASAEEFNAKYETFLNEYSTYNPSILRKRQDELEDMLRRNEAFRTESQRLLEQAREEMTAEVRAKLDDAIADIAAEYSLAFVLNTDADDVPYVNMKMAYNITSAVKSIVCK